MAETCTDAPTVCPDPRVLKARIAAAVRPDLDRIEAEIRRHLSSSVPLIEEVSRYILKSGGKRLRPLLMVLAARLSGYRGDRDAALSVAFEFLHTATLLHDDVVDRAEVRCNRPAANTVWGNPAVVLVGDFIYSTSILIAVEFGNIRILEVLSEATTRMAEGEVLQLVHSDSLDVTEAQYLDTITRKTAVLMSAACHIGGIFAGTTPAREEALRVFGRELGIAFQLTDDALDYVGDLAELGKPVGKDLREGRPTLPLIRTLAACTPAEAALIRRVFTGKNVTEADFAAVRETVERRGGIASTLDLAAAHIARAKDGLASAFPPHPVRGILSDMADYVLCRRA